jgi:hypothetical protein
VPKHIVVADAFIAVCHHRHIDQHLPTVMDGA